MDRILIDPAQILLDLNKITTDLAQISIDLAKILLDLRERERERERDEENGNYQWDFSVDLVFIGFQTSNPPLNPLTSIVDARDLPPTAFLLGSSWFQSGGIELEKLVNAQFALDSLN